MTPSTSSRRIVVIGAVAGGATCATRIRRLDEHVEILVLERGRHIGFANCGLPYYIGGLIEQRGKVIGQSADLFARRYNIQVRTAAEATAIDPAARTVAVLDRATGRTGPERFDKLVLAPGAAPIRPQVPGIDDPRIFSLRTVEDADAIASAAGSARRAAIVGGGFIGLELAENLRRRGLQVVLIEKLNQVLSPLDREMAAPLADCLTDNGVETILGDGLAEFADEEGRLAVHLASGRVVQADFAVLAIGVKPETALAASAGLRIGPAGGIAVNDHMQTSHPDVYAVGDAVELRHLVTGAPVLMPLAGPAHKQARVAADHLCGRGDSRYDAVQGTAIVGLFGLAAAATGANERMLARSRIAHCAVHVHVADHAGYYPGAQLVHVKLLFAPGDGRILGAQVTGRAGVDKRIDVLATAVRHRLTARDLVDLELAYAPQFGQAKDPVNIAGTVADNVLRGVTDLTECHALAAGDYVLDVRSPAELAAGTVPGAANVPVDELRSRLDELPADRVVHVCCGIGARAYLAERILKGHGYRAANLSGGYVTYRATQDARSGK